MAVESAVAMVMAAEVASAVAVDVSEQENNNILKSTLCNNYN